MRSSRRIAAVAAAAIMLTLPLTGCAAEAKDSAPVSSEPTPEPADDSGAEPVEVREPTVPATCEEILPIERVRGYDNRLESHSDGAEAQLAEMLGPVTMGTLRGGEQQTYCGWGIPNSGAIAYLAVAVIDDEAKATLLAALRDSVYEEVAPVAGAEATFAQGQSAEHRYTDSIVIGGDLLVVASHTVSGEFARDAFARLQD